MHTSTGPRCALICLLLAVAAPVFYVAAYLSLVDNSGRLEMRSDGRCYTRMYRCGGEVAERVFWPAHFCDVRLRPGYWGETLTKWNSR